MNYRMQQSKNLWSFLVLLSLCIFFSCESTPNRIAGSASTRTNQIAASPRSAEDLFVVDCLLPGQVRKLGKMTYMTARRPMRTTAMDCEIRGGEYIAYDRSNYATALNVWLPKAEEGDMVAQNHVGEIYQKGIGGTPQYEFAVIWFKKSADQGYKRAKLNLGYQYEQGLGIPKDPLKALNLYREATGLSETILADQEQTDILRKQNQELNELRQEVKQREAEAEALRRQLEEVQNELKRMRQEYDRRKSEIEKEHERIEQLKAQIEGDKPLLEQADRSKLKSLEMDLRRSEMLIAKQDEESLRLRNKISRLESEKMQASDSHAAELKVLSERLSGMEAQLKEQRREASVLKEEMNALEQAESSKLKALEVDLERREILIANKDEEFLLLKAEIKRLESEKSKISDSRAAELNALLDELNDMEVQLKDHRLEAAGLRQKLAESERLKDKTGKLNDKRIRQLEAELSRRSSELAARRSEAKDLNQQIARLDAMAKRYRSQLSLKQKSLAKGDGPTIEIINPRVVKTRGIRIVAVNPGVGKQQIIGNVKAPAGIYSFMVNQKDVELDSEGLFRTSIPLKQSEDTSVEIIAVDKKGRRADFNFLIPWKAAELETTPAKPGIAALNFGHYHALIIGNNNYQKYDKLSSAVNDAKEISEILAEKYNFKTKVLVNATRYEILKELDEFRRNLKENDNFLLYYAGHGELDKKNKRGYWLPVDAEPNSHVNDVPNFAITDILNNMEVKQAIIVADTCYSGILTRSAISRESGELTEEKRIKWLKKLIEKRSRTVLSSGGLKPVLDSGIGNHSVFARALIDTLESNQEVLEASRLHTKVGALVAYTSSELGLEQVPQYAANLHAGHIGGDFLFVPSEFQ